MGKWIKIADYVMSSKFDKFAFVIIGLFYIYIIIQIVRWIVC